MNARRPALLPVAGKRSHAPVTPSGGGTGHRARPAALRTEATAERPQGPGRARGASSGRRQAGRFRQGARGGGEAWLRCAGTRGRVPAARGLPEGSRSGPEGRESDPVRALRIGIAGRGRVQAHAMAAARGEDWPAEGEAASPVHGHRELREGALATQWRAPSPGCGEARRAAARGTGAGTARHARATGPSQPGGRTVHRQPRRGRLTEPGGRSHPAGRSGLGRNLRSRGGGSPRAVSAGSSPAVLARGGVGCHFMPEKQRVSCRDCFEEFSALPD